MTSHNLPQQSTLFIGRDRELSELAGLLADPLAGYLNTTALQG